MSSKQKKMLTAGVIAFALVVGATALLAATTYYGSASGSITTGGETWYPYATWQGSWSGTNYDDFFGSWSDPNDHSGTFTGTVVSNYVSHGHWYATGNENPMGDFKAMVTADTVFGWWYHPHTTSPTDSGQIWSTSHEHP